MIASECPPQPDQPGRTVAVGQARTRWIRGHRTALLWLAFAASSADAQTLRDAVERAWERQPAAQAQRYPGPAAGNQAEREFLNECKG